VKNWSFNESHAAAEVTLHTCLDTLRNVTVTHGNCVCDSRPVVSENKSRHLW
jgi:hypothetical protein